MSRGNFPSQTPGGPGEPDTGRRVRFAVAEGAEREALSSPGPVQALSPAANDAGSTPFQGLLRKYRNEEDDHVSGTPDIGKLTIDEVWDSHTASPVSDSIRALTSSAPWTELGSTAGRFASNTPGTTASSIGWQPNRLFGASPASSSDSTGGATPSCATPAIFLGGRGNPSHRHRLATAAGPSPAAVPPPTPLPLFSPSSGAVMVQSEFVLFADHHREEAEIRLASSSHPEPSPPELSPSRIVPSSAETLRSWPVADLSPVTSPWHGPDGIKRTSEGIPVETPATVTVFRGGRPPSSHRATSTNTGLTGSSFSSLATDLFGAAATVTPVAESSSIKNDDQVDGPTTTSDVDVDESLGQQQLVVDRAAAAPSTPLFPANPKTPSRLGSAARVPLYTNATAAGTSDSDAVRPPASSIKQNRELTALLADLSIQETETLAEGSQDIARGTLAMLTPVRTNAAVRRATGQSMVCGCTLRECHFLFGNRH